jgi:hypothetical protein
MDDSQLQHLGIALLIGIATGLLAVAFSGSPWGLMVGAFFTALDLAFGGRRRKPPVDDGA